MQIKNVTWIRPSYFLHRIEHRGLDWKKMPISVNDFVASENIGTICLDPILFNVETNYDMCINYRNNDPVCNAM